MSIKFGIVYINLFFILFSCSRQNQFPVKQTEKTGVENVVLDKSFNTVEKSSKVDSVRLNIFGNELVEIMQYIQWYEDQNSKFDLNELESLWNQLRNQSPHFSSDDLSNWIEITGFLLEITGKSRYGESMQEIACQDKSSFFDKEIKAIENRLIPIIFTKNVDHIHVNIFANATIKYEHTLKGAVEITQETNFPESGKVQLTFKMENKRYIELYIRIPDWAEGATVTEKGVKYVTIPGRYCQISRKWSTGDFVEIIIPIENIPAAYKIN